MKNKLWLALGLIFVVSNIASAQTAKKTVTNADLEKFKQKRVEAEADYRAKYRELGMPSPEELEQRSIEDQRKLAEYSQQKRYEKQEVQNYWLSQASLLRSEILNINAQIDYTNRLLGNLPTQNPNFITVDQLSSLSFPNVYYPYSGGYGRRQGNRARGNAVNPANNVQTVINASGGNPNPYYGTPLYGSSIKVVIGQQQDRNRYGRRGYGRNYAYGGYYPYVANGNLSQREELIQRLQYLGQTRAGLLAQWNNLVDEAYRAGVRLQY